MPSNWQNRIVKTGDEDPRTLIANPRNWRMHGVEQRKAMDSILEKIGWVQNVIKNIRTGNIIDGHMRVSSAIEHNEKTVPVTYVDLSEEEEKVVLTTFDSLSGLANLNAPEIESLIEDIDIAGLDIQVVLDKLVIDIEGQRAFEDQSRGSRESRESSPRTGDNEEVLQYSIVFSGPRDQEDWFKFLSWLKVKYSNLPTATQRIIEFLRDSGVLGE